jgi:hypothetical protein
MEDAMKEEKTLARREFTLAAALAALSGVVITISACGGGGSPTSPSTPPPTSGGGGTATDKTGVVGSNHGHTAVITGGQLTAAGALNLDIRGSSDHNHTVILAASEVASIAANQRVSKESSTDSAHSHSVTFN